MKYFFIFLFSTQVFAHDIVGTPVRKGELKTSLKVEQIKCACKVKVVKRENLKFEDNYGNPGYKINIEVDLGGFDLFKGKSVNFEAKYELTNMFTEHDEIIVKDFEYQSNDGKTKLFIDEEGYLKKVEFLYKNYQVINCNF